MNEATAPFWIKPPNKGQVFQSVKGQRRVVLGVDGGTVFYRTVGKASSNRDTHITCWKKWCDANLAFLL